MAAVAQLRLLADAAHGGSAIFYFLAVKLPQAGIVLDVPMDQEEDLLSAGVNLQRWLRIFEQFPVTEAITIIDTATYSAARDLTRAHMQAAGRFGDLTISYGSLSILHRKVKILSPVVAAAQPGAVSGSGVTGSPLASVLTAWRWKCTEVGA